MPNLFIVDGAVGQVKDYDAVKKIRRSLHYRQKAQLFQAEIARYDAATLFATLLEHLAATKQPVHESESIVYLANCL